MNWVRVAWAIARGESSEQAIRDAVEQAARFTTPELRTAAALERIATALELLASASTVTHEKEIDVRVHGAVETYQETTS